MRIALTDGTAGQALRFRTAIQRALLAASVRTEHITTAVHDPAITLVGVDVLLVFPNTAEDHGGSYQGEWADVAKRDGVKVFVPFDYGSPFGVARGDPPMQTVTTPLLAHCAALGLGVCRVLSGPAMDAVLPGILHIANDAAEVVGTGDTPISFVHSNDVGELVAQHCARAAASPEGARSLAGTVIAPVGDPKSLNEVLAIVGAVTGTPVQVTHRRLDEVQQALLDEFDFTQFLDWLMVAWETGRATQGDHDDDLAAALTYQTVQSVIRASERA